MRGIHVAVLSTAKDGDDPIGGELGILVDLAPPTGQQRTGLVLFTDKPPRWVMIEQLRWLGDMT